MTEAEPWVHKPVSAPRVHWLKHWLTRLHFGSRLAKEVESSDTCFCSKKRIIVALLVLAALIIMGLLLLLNYKCIMVWHLCYEDGDYAGVPSFGHG